MDAQIVLFLLQDGLTNGAIYALLALALVLVFAVTRVIFIPQGEFIAYGALTLAALQAGKLPMTLWMLVVLGALIAMLDSAAAWRLRDRRAALRALAFNLGYPVALAAALQSMPLDRLPLAAQVLLTLCVVVPLGPMIYRLVFQPIASATNLFLLIVAVATHLALLGLGLYFFGPEGSRSPPFTEGEVEFAGIPVQWQTVWVLGTTAALIVVLYLFFERTIYGKALRATAINGVGARLMGIPTELAGKLSFGLAAFIGAFSGVLISPITTVYYDTGFLIGLKGFVGAIIAGLASYPIAAVGAISVGIVESFGSFWASAYKEVIVFTLIIPVLLWRSLRSHHVDDEEH